MGDYGHELEFGVSVTPSAQVPERVVALATLADEVGLDLVTFQDHPYQARFLETWKLLSFVAARTTHTRIRFAQTSSTCRSARRPLWRGRSRASIS